VRIANELSIAYLVSERPFAAAAWENIFLIG